MRVVLTGASGQLGAYVLDRFLASGHDVAAWSGSEEGERSGVRLRVVDLTDPGGTARALGEADPEVVIHTAAISSVEEVRRDPRRGWEANVSATARLAEWCDRNGSAIVYTSTDLVFDGTRAMRAENDPARPVLEYGRTKRAGELVVLGTPRGVVARLSLLYGPARGGRVSYFDRTIAALRRGEPQTFFEDEFRTPLDFMTAADALDGLVTASCSGIVHVGGTERLSRFELARRLASALGFDPNLIRANRQSDLTFPETRPADVSLDTEKLSTLLPGLNRPTVEEAVARILPW